MNDPAEILCPFVCLTSCAALIFYAGWRFNDALRSRRTFERGTCRQCGYDVRHSPLRCPECGSTVPDETRLHVRLLNGDLPDYLRSDEAALPLREPGAGEAFKPLAILDDEAVHDRLLTLLGRAGVACESGLRFGTPVRYEVGVPERDFDLATELLLHVRRGEPLRNRE